MKNFTKESINKAIDLIEHNPELIKNRESKEYDIYKNNKSYPPILVLSEANKILGGKTLTIEDFNNSTKHAFEILESLGFPIIKKDLQQEINQNHKIWIEKTIVKNRVDRSSGPYALGTRLWTPIRDRRGADIYSLMRDVRKDDVVLHLTDNIGFSGVSRVAQTFIEGKGVEGSEWEGEAYVVELKDFTPITILERKNILNEKNKKVLNEIKLNHKVFYNSELNLNQGAYLTECPPDLADLINHEYNKLHNSYIPFLETPSSRNKKDQPLNPPSLKTPQEEFNYKDFYNRCLSANFFINEKLAIRFIASLLTKPFVILTGLSGSGKTKLAQAFVQWICQDESQYRIIPVGADWTNREPLLGYPNALKPEEYVKPDNGVLDLIIQAGKNSGLPYFLILDEMNLSHVERYFADFLSVMESKAKIPLYAENTVDNGIPAKLIVPSNLFIIGTVNIDETTNMFSPKVLDRANTIEFRVSQNEMEDFLEKIQELNMDTLNTKGDKMASSFIQLAKNKSFPNQDMKSINQTLILFFGELKKTGAEFGYRSATEMLRLINQLTLLDKELSNEEKIDIAIIQKLLPKLHGSRRKLCPILVTLGSFCINGDMKVEKDVFEKPDFDFTNPSVLYPLSLEKISRMHKGAIDNGFTSFAEA